MTSITPADNQGNLFQVRNFLPEEFAQKMLSVDWLSEPFERMEYQFDWGRRKITSHPLLEEMDKYIQANFNKINQACDITVEHCWSIIWIDEPGFVVDVHLDNPGLCMSLQQYWTHNDIKLGTEFYFDDMGQEIRYRCPYEPNTGYIMLNNTKSQWHAMMTPVPENTYRLSTYTYFYHYYDKNGICISGEKTGVDGAL